MTTSSYRLHPDAESAVRRQLGDYFRGVTPERKNEKIDQTVKNLEALLPVFEKELMSKKPAELRASKFDCLSYDEFDCINELMLACLKADGINAKPEVQWSDACNARVSRFHLVA